MVVVVFVVFDVSAVCIEDEDADEVDGRFAVADTIGGEIEVTGECEPKAVEKPGRRGDDGANAEVGRNGSPLLGEAGRSGEAGRCLTGESGREGEDGDCPGLLPGLTEALERAVGADVAEEEEAKILEGVARIVGDGSRALAVAEAGRAVMLFERSIGGLTGSARGRLPGAAVLDLTPDIGRTLGILVACVDCPKVPEGLEERWSVSPPKAGKALRLGEAGRETGLEAVGESL